MTKFVKIVGHYINPEQVVMVEAQDGKTYIHFNSRVACVTYLPIDEVMKLLGYVEPMWRRLIRKRLRHVNNPPVGNVGSSKL